MPGAPPPYATGPDVANALAVRDLLDSSNTPTIITDAGADDLTGAKRSPYIGRVSFSSWH